MKNVFFKRVYSILALTLCFSVFGSNVFALSSTTSTTSADEEFNTLKEQLISEINLIGVFLWNYGMKFDTQKNKTILPSEEELRNWANIVINKYPNLTADAILKKFLAENYTNEVYTQLAKNIFNFYSEVALKEFQKSSDKFKDYMLIHEIKSISKEGITNFFKKLPLIFFLELHLRQLYSDLYNRLMGIGAEAFQEKNSEILRFFEDEAAIVLNEYPKKTAIDILVDVQKNGFTPELSTKIFDHFKKFFISPVQAVFVLVKKYNEYVTKHGEDILKTVFKDQTTYPTPKAYFDAVTRKKDSKATIKKFIFDTINSYIAEEAFNKLNELVKRPILTTTTPSTTTSTTSTIPLESKPEPFKEKSDLEIYRGYIDQDLRSGSIEEAEKNAKKTISTAPPEIRDEVRRYFEAKRKTTTLPTTTSTTATLPTPPTTTIAKPHLPPMTLPAKPTPPTYSTTTMTSGEKTLAAQIKGLYNKFCILILQELNFLNIKWKGQQRIEPRFFTELSPVDNLNLAEQIAQEYKNSGNTAVQILQEIFSDKNNKFYGKFIKLLTFVLERVIIYDKTLDKAKNIYFFSSMPGIESMDLSNIPTLMQNLKKYQPSINLSDIFKFDQDGRPALKVGDNMIRVEGDKRIPESNFTPLSE
jgi:hypothetical protein